MTNGKPFFTLTLYFDFKRESWKTGPQFSVNHLPPCDRAVYAEGGLRRLPESRPAMAMDARNSRAFCSILAQQLEGSGVIAMWGPSSLFRTIMPEDTDSARHPMDRDKPR